MWLSPVDVPGNVSTIPSPQFTVTPEIAVVLETVKETATVVPVLAGLGVGVFTLTVGGGMGVWTVTDADAWPVDPLLSVATIVTV